MAQADYDLEAIISQFVDANSICRACGHNHSFQPDFENVKTSIDDISEFFGMRLVNV
jgi:hypothetical protein